MQRKKPDLTFNKIASSVDFSPKGSWMFRGVGLKLTQEIISSLFSSKNWGPYYDNKKMLTSLKDFFLPNKINEMAYVEESHHLYFTLKDKPNTIYAQLVPSVKHISDIFMADYDMLKSYHNMAVDFSVIPSMKLDTDIISLYSSRQSLYVITEKRGRHYSDQMLLLSRIGVNPNVGFQKSETKTFKLNIPDSWQEYLLKNNNLPHSLSVAEKGPYISTVFISGPCKPYICRGEITEVSNIFLKDIIPNEYLLQKERLPLSIVDSTKHRGFYQFDETTYNFYISGIGSKNIYTMTIYEKKIDIKSHVEESTYEIEMLSLINLDLPHMPGMESPKLKSIEMILGFDKTQKQIVTAFIFKKKVKVLPLIGGGKKPLEDIANSDNLLDYELPIINRIVVIPDVCIIAGNKENSSWFIIQLPRRLFALSQYRNNSEYPTLDEEYLS